MAVPVKLELRWMWVGMGVMARMSVALGTIAWRRKMGRAVGVSLLLFYTLFIFWIALIKMGG